MPLIVWREAIARLGSENSSKKEQGNNRNCWFSAFVEEGLARVQFPLHLCLLEAFWRSFLWGTGFQSGEWIVTGWVYYFLLVVCVGCKSDYKWLAGPEECGCRYFSPSWKHADWFLAGDRNTASQTSVTIWPRQASLATYVRCTYVYTGDNRADDPRRMKAFSPWRSKRSSGETLNGKTGLEQRLELE